MQFSFVRKPHSLILLACLALAMPGSSDSLVPAWWSQPHASDPAAPATLDVPAAVNANTPNNKGPANVGQAKHMARSAILALRTRGLTQLAADIEANLVGANKPIASWAAPATPIDQEKQKAPLLIGQLKAIAHPFYNRLNEVDAAWVLGQIELNHTPENAITTSAVAGEHYWHVTATPNFQDGYYPWNPATPNAQNQAIATIGQLKAVFSLRFESLPLPFTDEDNDSMDDSWELANELDPTDWSDAYDDDDFDGIPNLYEYRIALDPWNDSTNGTPDTENDRDDDGMPDFWEVTIGHPDGPWWWNEDQWLWNETLQRYEFVRLLDWENAADAALDPDGDGLTNLVEFENSTDPFNPDTDGDFMPDGWEIQHDLVAAYRIPSNGDWIYGGYGADGGGGDPDADGIQNRHEYALGFHPTIPNPAELTADRDNDGMLDRWEATYETWDWDSRAFIRRLDWENPADAALDPDGDGLTNLAEYENSTDPFNPDTDGDFIPDGWEVHYDFDPLDSGDTYGDPDMDGIENQYEYVLGFHPRHAFPDGTLEFGMDRDGDGITDLQEAFTGEFKWSGERGMHVFMKVLDWEVADAEGDPDDDGLSNVRELAENTNLLDPDSDSDGLWDGFEVQHGFNPHVANPDTGTDVDGDGYTLLEEAQGETNPNDPSDKPYRIVYSRPVSNETAVPRHKVLVIGLDRPLPSGVVIPSFVRLDTSGQLIGGVVQILSGGKTLVFISSIPFAANTKYRITLSKNGTGIPFMRYDSGFITESELGDTKPFMMTTTPMDGNINVSRNMIVSSYWNEPLNETTLDANSVKLIDSAGNQVPCTLRNDPFWHRLDLIPVAQLEAGATYSISLGTEIQNLRGQSLGYSPPWSFTTIGNPLPPPTNGPYVTAMTPGHLARNVALNVAIEVTWSEAMNAATLNAGTCKLTQAWNGEEVPVNLTYSSTANRLTIRPVSILKENTAYILRFSEGVQSASGISFSQSDLWQGYFRTAMLPGYLPGASAGGGSSGSGNPAWNNPGAGGPGIGVPPCN